MKGGTWDLRNNILTSGSRFGVYTKNITLSKNRMKNVRIKLINETGHIVKLFLDDLCFDGETMSYTEWQGAPHSTTRKKTALCSETVKNSITI